jgi:uncharacterized repeat protein (TIGR01451 family)
MCGLIIALGLFSAAVTIPVVRSSPSWGWTVYYDFDSKSYEPGASGTVSISLANTGDVSLQIREVGIQFDWQQSANKWWSQQVSSTVDPGQRATLTTVSFSVPSGTSEGKHQFRVGIYQSHMATYLDPYSGYYYTSWVDDGLQWMRDWDSLTIEALKPVLNFVSVTSVPPLNGPLYVGETLTYVVIVSNTGNAKAESVKVALEDLSPDTGLSVKGSDTKDIDPGTTGQWKIDVLGGLPGEYKGTIRVYAGSVVMSEQAWQLQVAAPPVSIAAKDISPSGPIYAGDVITVTYRLRNDGPVDANSISFDIKTSDGVTITGPPTVTQIPSQSEVTATLTLRADKTGTASVQVSILGYGTVLQRDAFNLDVTERPLWLQSWFLPAVAAVVIALLVVLVIAFRRRQSVPKQPSVLTSLPEQAIPAGPATACPRCGRSLTFVQARSKYYCTKCKEYF